MKTPLTPSCLKALQGAAFLAAASLFLIPAANATILVDSGDITTSGGVSTYSFQATGNQLLAKPADSITQVNNAFYSASRIDWRAEGTATYFANPWSGGTSTIILAWDFSSTSFRPESMDVYDRVFMVAAATGVTVTTAWSDDLATWHDIRAVTSTGTNASSYTTTPDISLSSFVSSTLYYRVTFEVASDGTYANSGQGTQWGRSGPDQTAFSITFNVAAVPEPATWVAITGLVVLGLAGFVRRHRRQSR
ncbi:hypothetical protein OPIT5_28020 [Opitutaceae bacterium TAV5]|nr:hypothetical protein OPIT5_28020 [Opitutaceae bacterium TAV5]